ncbi:MAG: hypothetical protein PHP35_01985 [Candidatus Colwellbacteria bacterium]|nr:hypothetical protein [Candidatus Colwellbacteria bacterium]
MPYFNKERIKANLIFLVPFVILIAVLVFFRLSREDETEQAVSPINDSGAIETQLPAEQSCGILDDSLCSSAEFAVLQGERTSGIRINVPLDTKIYAPYDGVVIFGDLEGPDGKKTGELITFTPGTEEEPVSDANTIRILSSDFEMSQEIRSGDLVTKGQSIATVKSTSFILPSRDDNTTNILVLPDSEPTASTPAEYLKALID